MSQTAIQVDNISKLYHLGKKASGSLRETISNAVTQRFSRKNNDQPDETEFWALKDVSFTVNQGDVVGIIGKNGAGKSTLLKILSRITEPTTGRIQINGRVGSLLEVGTGFHPELSGRENIFLNGSILGMRRSEIQAKFDEIVEFSGIEKFIDTPVKRYSSGMYVRLAFSVAAHLEPEVLIIDEVLAVGDAEFQKKCLGKMQDVAGHGRTVLFVSHNIGTLSQLCQAGVYLDKGRIKLLGSISEVVTEYTNETRFFNSNRQIGYQDELFSFGTIEIGSGYSNSFFSTKDQIPISLSWIVKIAKSRHSIVLTINKYGQRVTTIFVKIDDSYIVDKATGHFRVSCNIPANLLTAGDYSLDLYFGIAKQPPIFHLENALGFTIILKDEDPTYSSFASERTGLIGLNPKWNKI